MNSLTGSIKSMEPTGGSRFGQRAFVSQRRLPPVAHAWRSGYICISVLLCLLWAINSGPSLAAEVPPSRYAPIARSHLEALAKGQTNTQYVLSITNLPAAIREKLGETADTGQPYADGCIGRPRRRFLAATRAEHTYIVAFEQGGFVPTWHLWRFVVDTNGKVVRDNEIEPIACNAAPPHR